MDAQRSAGQFRSSFSSLDQDEMNVYLKIMKTVHMKVKGTDTIGTLKANINQKKGISEINQKLFFEGKLLSNAQTIAGCGIQNHSTLHLFANDDAVTKILVNLPSSNRTITLEAKANQTVRSIKLLIQEKEGIRPNSFTLVYNGNLMEDERSLASIGVKNNSIVHLVSSKNEVLTVFVKTRQAMEAVKLLVKSMFTIGDVKAIVMGMISERFISNMSLYCEGELLDDSKTLAFYEIKEGSNLDLLFISMQIFIKTWIGKTLTLKVKVLDKVEDVIKNAFAKLQKSVPANAHASLVYAGKCLESCKDLASYGIQHDSTLLLVVTAPNVALATS